MTVFQHLIRQGKYALSKLAVVLLLLAHAPFAEAEVFYGITTAGIFSVDSLTGGPATQLVTFATPLANAQVLGALIHKLGALVIVLALVWGGWVLLRQHGNLAGTVMRDD